MEKNRIKRRIKAFYPNFYEDNLISYVSLRISKYFNNEFVEADIMGICSDKSVKSFKTGKNRIYRDAISPMIWPILRRFLSQQAIIKIAERRFYFYLQKGDIVYLWPGVSLELYKKLHNEGFVIISERINTLLGNSRKLLDAEHERLGKIPDHGITDELIEDELACMQLSDFIFSPSPGVTDSIIDAGYLKGNILQTSYGLKQEELIADQADPSNDKRIKVLFVGSIGIRKGVHLLLEAWEKADVDAELIIVGRVSANIQDIFTNVLQRRPEIKHLDYLKDLKPVYKNADVFILPSIEEGSPLVSYLALGAGIPLIVSHMGSGGIVTDGKEGVIVEPHDIDALADAICRLVENPIIREKMSIEAKNLAPAYLWKEVADRRRSQILEKLKL